jgi:hypothetical protein
VIAKGKTMTLEKKNVRRKPRKKTPLTVTGHQQLAARCLALLDELAAIIPRLEETVPARARTGPRRLNISLVFLGTAIDSVEKIRALQAMKRLDVKRGRDTLQLVEAFRPVRQKLAAFDRRLLNVINTRRSSLAGDALETYAVAKSLALNSRSTTLLACVRNMQRALGRRGRRRKT